MAIITMRLSAQQAESLATALCHTRREYLSLTDRQIVHELSQKLMQFERPLSIQGMRQMAHQRIAA